MTANNDALINTPFGAVAISSNGGQLAITLLAVPACSNVQVTKPSADPLVAQVCKQVLQYLQQPAAKFDLPLMQQGTAFQQRVWQAIASIPLGEVRTYSELAREVGSGPRAVANACGANKLPLLVPCHRVVAQHGLGGFMQGKENGLSIKQWLLKHEGVRLTGADGE
ncbi:MAG TPA: methylated-DNA--[protein]-cysteine S-methyltransferase [Methylotenera sp.]|jgi:methylated-DNA-[protein]-cysteine S-methyltransferase